MNLSTKKQQVEQILVHSQDYPFTSLELDPLLEKWYNAKAKYIARFGTTIWQSPEKITIKLTDEIKKKKFESLLCCLSDDDLMSKAENDITFEEFLRDNEAGFFENKVVYPYPEIKVQKGMKLLKCFKYFLPSFTATRTIQDLASRFIQEDKIEGYLYLSVDPIDFLTMSESNSNWRSCHSLDGDYRAGNLSYMVDDTTIVAYLASDKKENLRALPTDLQWCSKKWRMLVHTNNFNSVIYYDRQYPFDSEILEVAVADILNGFNHKTFNPPNHNGFSTVRIPGWAESLSLDHNFILGGNDCIYDTRDIVDTSDFLGYSDIILSPYYTPSTSLKKGNSYYDVIDTTEIKSKKIWDKEFHKVYDIKIGEKVPCVKCGKHYIKRTDSFLCDDCIAVEDADEDFYLVCETCGSRIYDRDEAEIINGELTCKTCADAINKERNGDI